MPLSESSGVHLFIRFNTQWQLVPTLHTEQKRESFDDENMPVWYNSKYATKPATSKCKLHVLLKFEEPWQQRLQCNQG